jgi:hypothetical protein
MTMVGSTRATATLHSRIIAIVGMMVVTATSASAGSSRIDAPPHGIELGLGWNTNTESVVHNRCILFAPIQEGGQKATLSLSEVSDSEELRKHLGVSVSASIKGIAASGSGSAEFAEDTAVKTSSTNFAVRAAITNGAMFAGPHRPPAPRRYAFSATDVQTIPTDVEKPEEPGPQADAVRVLDWVLDEVKKASGDQSAPANPTEGEDENDEYNRFVKLCGTHFISAIYSGVEMFNVISITTTDEASKQAVKAAVEASYGVGAGEAKADESIDQNLSKTNAKTSFFQRGGAGGILPSSREKVLQKLDVIAQEASDAPEFFDIEITPYADLPNWPYSKEPEEKDTKNIIVRRYYQLKTLYRDLQAVIDNLRALAQDTADPKPDDTPQPANYDTCFSVEYYEEMQDAVITLLQLIESAQLDVVKSGWNYANFTVNMDESAEALSILGTAPDTTPPAPANDGSSALSNPFLEWLNQGLPAAYLKARIPPLKIGGKSQCEEPTTEAQRTEYRRRVMDLYVRPGNTRTCQESTTDPDCLTNQALNQVEQWIPYPLGLADVKPGAKGYLCSAGPKQPRDCVSSKLDGSHLAMTRGKPSAALVTIEKGSKNDSVVLRIAIETPNKELVKIKQGGKRYKSKTEPLWVYFVDAAKQGDKELSWIVVPGKKGVVRFQDATGNKLCLLDHRGVPAVYEKVCTKGGSSYVWYFFTEEPY